MIGMCVLLCHHERFNVAAGLLFYGLCASLPLLRETTRLAKCVEFNLFQIIL